MPTCLETFSSASQFTGENVNMQTVLVYELINHRPDAHIEIFQTIFKNRKTHDQLHASQHTQTYSTHLITENLVQLSDD